MLSSSLDHIRSSILTTAATFPGGSSELTRGNVPVAMCITLGKRTNALEENVMDQHSAKVLTMRRQRQSVKSMGISGSKKRRYVRIHFGPYFALIFLTWALHMVAGSNQRVPEMIIDQRGTCSFSACTTLLFAARFKGSSSAL